MPLKPPTLSFRGMGNGSRACSQSTWTHACLPCMLSNTHVDSPHTGAHAIMHTELFGYLYLPHSPYSTFLIAMRIEICSNCI